jgi:GTP cyclohydrolase I
MESLQTEDVAVIIEAKHLCVSSRGVQDDQSETITVFYNGKFKEAEMIQQLHQLIKD